MRSKAILATVIFALVIIIDQAVKIYVKTHFYLGESLTVTTWFKILFIENNGMAFGMELGSKLILTVLRVVIASLLIVYIRKILSNPALKTGYLVTLTLVAAGAFGNIIDCLFYGLIFDNPAPPMVAQFVEIGQGYAPFMMGRVVDMLYFPLFSFDWPAWIPFIGGERFMFFQPVFNIADSAVSVGILMLIFFYSSQLTTLKVSEKSARDEDKK